MGETALCTHCGWMVRDEELQRAFDAFGYRPERYAVICTLCLVPDDPWVGAHPGVPRIDDVERYPVDRPLVQPRRLTR